MTLSQVRRYIGPYELQEEIGRGGMSRVYRAFDPTMDREVAVKVLTSVVAQDEEYQRRFRREITTACELEHPFILPVYDYGRMRMPCSW
jgi:serine/threonine-protein kinase